MWLKHHCMISQNFFVKSHGLGNEYIVFDSKHFSIPLTPQNIGIICNVHFGIGSDGILLLEPSSVADFKIRIYNPDGSEAEKSGNGLRIFSKFLYDYKYTENKIFTIETIGGIVTATIDEVRNNKAFMISIEMGKAIFESKKIPVLCKNVECIDFPLQIEDKNFKINCVSVGNPHCQIFTDTLDPAEVHKYGPYLETHSMFPNRINVQFVKVLSKNKAEILIWERGVGYTMASGSSSSAVACMLKKKRYINNDVEILMPGGILKIHIDDNWDITLCGEAKQVAEGVLSEEFINELINTSNLKM